MLPTDRAKECLKAGEFQKESMAPKVASAIDFIIESGGKEALITSPRRTGKRP